MKIFFKWLKNVLIYVTEKLAFWVSINFYYRIWKID